MFSGNHASAASERLPLAANFPAPLRFGKQVCAVARHYCETLGRNGGYILSPTHLFQPDVPPENVLAVYDTAGR